MKNTIGLDVQQAQQLTEKLNDLLANYQLYYQNLRGLHWNINGREFFELHQKFEEFYEDAFLKIDEIAERILTLGAAPSRALKLSKAIRNKRRNRSVLCRRRRHFGCRKPFHFAPQRT